MSVEVAAKSCRLFRLNRCENLCQIVVIFLLGYDITTLCDLRAVVFVSVSSQIAADSDTLQITLTSQKTAMQKSQCNWQKFTNKIKRNAENNKKYLK